MLQFLIDNQEVDISSITNFKDYQNALLHSWLKTLTILGYTLVPIFFVLDVFIIPDHSRYLLPRFGIYRAVSTFIVVLQFFLILRTKPSQYSFLHGYFFMLIVGIAIILMTVDLGGFDSSYYAGLNLVIIAINLLLPWQSYHSAINGGIIILLYVIINWTINSHFQSYNLVNNLYFMVATVIIASSINHVKYLLIQKEFESRQDLKQARDALWSEMEIAKRIQTALLPTDESLSDFEIAGIMKPADEVGGDYYDIILTNDSNWVAIGDVSGHGVESGLIMMMSQTGIRTMIYQNKNSTPAEIINKVNPVLKENIARLNVDRYMTLCLLSLEKDRITFSGKHQDIYHYCKSTDSIQVYPTSGTWLGVLDDISPFTKNNKFTISQGDVILLITDGITEITNKNDEMFGEERLLEELKKNSSLQPKYIIEAILKKVEQYRSKQEDDITVVVIKRK